MITQQNTIFLAYSQDAVRRLPMAISSSLCRYGYDVYLDKRHFRRFAPPPEHILNEIERRSHYVLLLTPASVRYGFNFSEKRLAAEIRHAKQVHRHIVVLWGYSQKPFHLGWWMRSSFPEEFESLGMESLKVANLAASLNELLSSKEGGIESAIESDHPERSEISEADLQAEALVDAGLTEKYDEEIYNRRSGAVTYFNEALQLDPAYARAYFERAEYLYGWIAKTDVEQILADYNTAIQLEPDEARYYSGRATLYDRIRDYGAALADYTSAIRYAREEATYYSSRAQVYLSIRDFLSALADYTVAIQLNPHNARYFFARSDVYLWVKDFQSAVNDIDKAIELDPNPRYFVLRGFLHSDLQQPENAEADWNTAVEVSKYPSSTHFFKAQMHFRRGETSQALLAVEQILAIEPDSKGALGLRKQILGQAD